MCAQKLLRNDPARIGGLDTLRVTAMLLVLTCHQSAVWNLGNWTSFHGLDMGQAGVSLFLAISGLLAAKATRSPSAWMVTRLRRVFPPYWVALIVSFFLTALFKYKKFEYPLKR